MDLLQLIRDGCRRVAEVARHVHVEPDRVADYALGLPLERAVAPTLDAERHYFDPRDERATAAFFVTLDAINFGSGYFPQLRKRPGMSGYFTVAASLTDHFRRHGPIPADRLAAITRAECATLFGQEGTGPAVDELMGLFAKALNDLGRLLIDRYDGQVAHLIESADHSARKLVGLLDAMPFFHDVQRYAPLGLDVPFFKRAQLTAADLSLALGGRGLGRFDDLRELTIFADNLVPHVLRIDGVLRYEPTLGERIDREELIPAGSEEEVEIRACAVNVVERMAAALRARGRDDVTVAGLDYVLWNRGQERHYKTVKPRHRSRTVFY